MAGLQNKHADMEIGYVGIGKQKKLYIRIGQEMEYYGTLMSGKADKFLKMQKDWDRQATEKCACMQIKVHGRKKTVGGFRQLDFRDLGI